MTTIEVADEHTLTDDDAQQAGLASLKALRALSAEREQFTAERCPRHQDQLQSKLGGTGRGRARTRTSLAAATPTRAAAGRRVDVEGRPPAIHFD